MVSSNNSMATSSPFFQLWIPADTKANHNFNVFKYQIVHSFMGKPWLIPLYMIKNKESWSRRYFHISESTVITTAN